MIINDILTLQVLAAECPTATLFDTDYDGLFGKRSLRVGFSCALCAVEAELNRARMGMPSCSASGWELRPDNDSRPHCYHCSCVCYTSVELYVKFTTP